MTVEERRGGGSKFPVGLRVLAVDDDRACLKLLDALLRRCQYHVTTTNQAIDALNLLRSNKSRFDLVISDVHMPDMDGFKLLELVGLELDLPVIMLSANSDPKAVMKGITHGACDYLLKPVRLEELKNIWQHVVRRKKFDSRDTVSVDGAKSGDGNHHHHHHLHLHDGTRLGRRKRTDQNGGNAGDGYDDNDDDSEEDGHDNINDDDDSSSSMQQKKPRVVWSVELHRKFVAAVHHLGIDKAMPKRILDLMNVEKLTRENVASHLQKYRLYLKRISTVSTTAQQATFPTIASLQQGNSAVVGSGLYNNLASSGIIQLGHHHHHHHHGATNSHNLSFSGSLTPPQPNLVHDMPSSSINLHHYRHTTPPVPLPMNGRSSGGTSSYDSKFHFGKSFHDNIPSNSAQLLLPQPHNIISTPFGHENISSKSKNVVVSSFPEDFQRGGDGDGDRGISFGGNMMSLPTACSNQTWQRLNNDPIPRPNSMYSNNININPTQVAEFGNDDDDKSMMNVCTNSYSCFIDDIPTYTQMPATSSKEEQQLQWNFSGGYDPFDDLASTIAKQVEDLW